MKKKWIVALAAVLLTVLLLTFVGPYLVLAAARQPAPEENYAYSQAFFTTYEQTRQGLQDLAKGLREQGALVVTESYPIDADDGLYIDKIYLPAEERMTNLILLTTGVHGVEGYIGAAMLEVFFQEVYPTLDKKTTGVMVVANVNPYGMKYYRRYNENNVDLNRNFILDWDSFDLASNREYPQVQTFLEPKGKIKNAFWHEVSFYWNLGVTAVTDGADTISDALLTGQYQSPQGVYYGGNGDEASTVYLKDIFEKALSSAYENVVHIDIHSGYGPRYHMVIFNSVYETMTEAQTKEAFGYDYVISHDSEDFYATTGDTTDFFYRLAEQKQSDKQLFSTCFEFGTVGDDFFDTILSLKYTVDENRQHWYPSSNAVTAEVVRQNYMELFYPTETAWREQAVADFVAATMGVLQAKMK